jgi:hypothetical protein
MWSNEDSSACAFRVPFMPSRAGASCTFPGSGNITQLRVAVDEIPSSAAWLERIAPLIVTLLIVLIMVQVAIKRRSACRWTLKYARDQILLALAMIIIGVIINAAAPPTSIASIATAILI